MAPEHPFTYSKGLRDCLQFELSVFHLEWSAEEDGMFSFQSAFQLVRTEKGSTFSFKHCWHPKQTLNIKIFQWKILNNILPTTDNLNRFQLVLNPSICPMCRAQADSMNHLLFKCKVAQPIWIYFMKICGIPNLSFDNNLRQLFINWWLQAGSKSVLDLFKHNLPGIICWHLWKAYSGLLWGSENRVPTSGTLIAQIKSFTQNWAYSFSRIKLRVIGNILIEEKLIPLDFRLTGTIPRFIKWQKPHTLKLNTDASYSPQGAFGGVMMRNKEGLFIFAMSFPLQANFVLEAEIRAVILATRWAMDAGFSSFQVETDSMAALGHLVEPYRGRWRVPIQEMLLDANRKGVTFRHTWREANGLADKLAQLNIFNVIADLPDPIRRAYIMDKFGIPSIRL
ncbi:unnamed protein product [Cuscuta europaea]|uniref:RNase H type-1 domain-containing protein n=1 Tax=Cuscuta europaea TaxID=41803 RepID=A0A9P0ZE24_CUSEU|nr:unnamed protein product [Cuscuta europaea]